jgi:intracellular sulfur oxidation DsrE/DsrF family protein
MSREEQFSDEFLNAFVDNQLSAEEKSQVFGLISQDEQLNRRVCELRKIRDLIQLAYANPPAHDRTPPGRGWGRRLRYQVAAGILLMLGITGGWVVHHSSALSEPAIRWASAPTKGVKVMLHLNSDDPDRMKEVLDEAENLLKFYKTTNQVARVEVITNGGGLNLLRSDTTPYAERIKRMYLEYNNLVFVACQNTIDRLKHERGIVAKIVPEAVVIDSAVAQIMRRQQQGWAYIQV